ncbi:MAG TPA: TatD family hydrolase [Candidatus Aphodovivens avistercoris]|nr:TatD family hydrolase [Candidatus Aphodovivens avistercoris]
MPRVRFAVGCHPHNAKHYDDALELKLRELLVDPRVSAVGEIGLDYHYDFSPREDQRTAFRRQIRVAKEAGLPLVLHVREAHDDAFAILQDEGFPEAGTLLHCFNLDWAELERWVDVGCYVAFGGPLTFKKADEVRDAAARVPQDRLLTETDAPYMTPEPLRGAVCGPEHVVFTVEKLCEVRGLSRGEEREAFLNALMANARGLLDREPTPWQREQARQLGVEELSPAERARAAVAQWRAGR